MHRSKLQSYLITSSARASSVGGTSRTKRFRGPQVGTFLATLTGFLSVSVIAFRENPHIFWTIMIMLGWVFGVIMQIIGGTIARTRT
jgi:hypothetical protein